MPVIAREGECNRAVDALFKSCHYFDVRGSGGGLYSVDFVFHAVGHQGRVSYGESDGCNL